MHSIWYIPGQSRFSTGEAGGPLTFFAIRLRCRGGQDSTDVRLEQTKRKQFKSLWRIGFKQHKNLDFRCLGHGMFPAFSFVVSTWRTWVHSSLMWPKMCFPHFGIAQDALTALEHSELRVERLRESWPSARKYYSGCFHFARILQCVLYARGWGWLCCLRLRMLFDHCIFFGTPGANQCSTQCTTRFTVLSHNPLCTTQLENSRPKAPSTYIPIQSVDRKWRVKLVVGRCWFPTHFFSNLTFRPNHLPFWLPLWTRPFF